MKIQNPLKKIVLVFFALFTFYAKVISQYSMNNNGITLCGAEFGEKQLPGILNLHYTYPTMKDIQYFHQRVLNSFNFHLNGKEFSKNLEAH